VYTNNQNTFAEIINGTKPVLVDFFTDWCGPCKMMKPVLEELKNRMGEDIIILKVDVDKNLQVAHRYGIQGVPTLIIFKNGKLQWRHSGVMSASQLESKIREVQN
jgi:thioredoxin 1